MPNPVGPIRSGLTPQGRDDSPVGHRCGQCRTPLGLSAIPCKNDPEVIAAARRSEGVTP